MLNDHLDPAKRRAFLVGLQAERQSFEGHWFDSTILALVFCAGIVTAMVGFLFTFNFIQ